MNTTAVPYVRSTTGMLHIATCMAARRTRSVTAEEAARTTKRCSKCIGASLVGPAVKVTPDEPVETVAIDGETATITTAEGVEVVGSETVPVRARMAVMFFVLANQEVWWME